MSKRGQTKVRGVRGATTVSRNDGKAILDATSELLTRLTESNEIDTKDLAAAWFTVTADLDAEFPAKAARAIGWTSVPLMDAQEVPVPGSLSRCIRVLLLWNTTKESDEIVHVYLGEARSLRPDLSTGEAMTRGRIER